MKFIFSVGFILVMLTFLAKNVCAATCQLSDQEGFIVVSDIHLNGNKTTKDYIIYRELLFEEGDTILLKNYEHVFLQSARNLNNTGLFNFVFIDTLGVKTGTRVDIHLVERWYIWPVPHLEIAERNFNTWWKGKNLSKINYGLALTNNNFRGRREYLEFFFQRGFEESYNMGYNMPYINRNQTLGAGAALGYSRNKGVPYRVRNNKLEYFILPDYYIKEQFSATLHLRYRKDIHQTHNLWVSYINLNYADTIVQKNNMFSQYGMQSNKFFKINYIYRDDHRDAKAYPLSGYFFDFEIMKYGLGILKNEALNTMFVKLRYRRFLPLKNKFYFALSNNVKWSNYSYQPFFIKTGLGYDNNYVRGYEYYVVEGISYWHLKTNLKYEILEPRTQIIDFISSEKFNMIHYALYINLFLDAGYTYDFRNSRHLSNDLTETLLLGYGVGVDFVTYYDKVVRFEYSLNKMKESGFFINFVAPI